MKFTAQQIADFLNGEVVGDATVQVDDVSKVEEGRPGTITFLANPKYTHFIYTTKASIVLVNKNFEIKEEISATLIRVDDAYTSIAKLLNLVEQARTQKSGIENNSYIAASATYSAPIYIGAFSYIDENVVIGENVKIYPQVYIGENVTIGNNVTLYPGVKIYHGCVIGDNAILHAGCVIGADGFGFAPTPNGYSKIAQVGNVVIEADVEIGANTTIDRATMGSTIVRKGTKLDNLIQLAHNVEVGEHTVIAALTGVAGSSKVGSHCMIGGQTGIVGHLKIGDYVELGAKSGVTKNLKDGSKMAGILPVDNVRDFHRSAVMLRRLPELYKTIEQLQQEIEQLKSKLD